MNSPNKEIGTKRFQLIGQSSRVANCRLTRTLPCR